MPSIRDSDLIRQVSCLLVFDIVCFYSHESPRSNSCEGQVNQVPGFLGTMIDHSSLSQDNNDCLDNMR